MSAEKAGHRAVSPFSTVEKHPEISLSTPHFGSKSLVLAQSRSATAARAQS
jgi:hypothetical protein